MSSELRFDESIISNKGDLSELGKKIFNTNYQKKKDISEFTLSDLNNYIGADRKLIINEINEFWIHDIIMIHNSSFFNKLLNTKEIKPTKTDEINIEGNKIIKTYITIPHSEFFFRYINLDIFKRYQKTIFNSR